MTPREQANYLIEQHVTAINEFDLNCCPTNNLDEEIYLIAVNCAIVTVNTIIELEVLTDEGWLNVPQEYKVQYWREVKTILEFKLNYP